jgi:putative NIF3 family GTP cyclohydrolase 1 type 2
MRAALVVEAGAECRIAQYSTIGRAPARGMQRREGVGIVKGRGADRLDHAPRTLADFYFPQ